MSRITINSNQLSMNAQRRLGDATSSLSQSFNRLSSGLRINRAVDDAAGLAVSETLKLDSRLSTQALRNVNDGISMISIINGALDAQKGILYRMAELAEQSANGVISSAQRKPLQAEYASLQDEFDRVASSAKFNGISLLRNPNPTTIGLMAGITGASESLLTVAAANSHRFAGVVRQVSNLDNNGIIDFTDVGGWSNLMPVLGSGQAMQEGVSFQNFAQVNFTDSQGNAGVLDLLFDRIMTDIGLLPPHGVVSPPASLGVNAVARSSNGESVVVSLFGMGGTNPAMIASSASTFTMAFNFPVGGSSASISIDLSDIRYESRESGFAVRETNIGFTNIVSQYFAKNSLDTVKNRIDDLSKLQGEFGAVEARLSVAANQLSVNRENFQSAASQITDVDVASEAAILTRTQILQQSAAAVLAQANQQPELALQLLRGI